ncbi:response regulator [bacterium]|nr:response regulator [candidate division CSSED10-310 bacterium]
MRILIAEDDLTNRNMLAAVLKKVGFDPVEARDGIHAWEEIGKPDAPRLIILDWMMPGMDGMEILRRVRSLPIGQSFYILMLTSKIEKAEIIAGLAAGANDYLAKPFDPGELQARVEVGRRMLQLQDILTAKIGELSQALAEIKTLRGILPICANCHKIRDDKGYWKKVEVYIRDHSEAEFSHGICPDCMKKLYPAFVKNPESND